MLLNEKEEAEAGPLKAISASSFYLCSLWQYDFLCNARQSPDYFKVLVEKTLR